MRVLLTSNASYEPPRGGSTRSNLMWLRHLVASGHACRVVCASDEGASDAQFADPSGLEIHSYRQLSRRVSVLSDEIRSFLPDWVLVSSEDLSHVLLREAAHAAPGRIVYLAHTPQWYPFGPASWYSDAEATAIVRGAAGVVAISSAMASYIHEYSGAEATVIHPPMYGSPPYPMFGSFDAGSVLMVNPSVVKGISTFLALAERFPDVEFAGLAGWATTQKDREDMARLPNVRVLESVGSIDEVLRDARLLLMPSLWLEGFGLIAMEAMLRGLPVIASDSGGLKEAKAGTGFVITVRQISRFEATFDERNMPRAVEPPQEIGPWTEALKMLLTDRAAYESESARSRAAALRFVSNLRVEAFEEFLLKLAPKPAEAPTATPPRRPELSPGQRALLLKRLRERR